MKSPHQCPPARQRCPACPQRRLSSHPGRQLGPLSMPHLCFRASTSQLTEKHIPLGGSSAVWWHFCCSGFCLYSLYIFLYLQGIKKTKNKECECNKYCILKNYRMFMISYLHGSEQVGYMKSFIIAVILEYRKPEFNKRHLWHNEAVNAWQQGIDILKGKWVIHSFPPIFLCFFFLLLTLQLVELDAWHFINRTVRSAVVPLFHDEQMNYLFGVMRRKAKQVQFCKSATQLYEK